MIQVEERGTQGAQFDAWDLLLEELSLPIAQLRQDEGPEKAPLVATTVESTPERRLWYTPRWMVARFTDTLASWASWTWHEIGQVAILIKEFVSAA